MKYTLITGASGNLGWSLTKSLLKNGKNVIFTSRDNTVLSQMYKELDKLKLKSKWIGQVVDLASNSSIHSFTNWIKEKDVTSFISCAGIDNTSNIEKLNLDDLQYVFAVNFFAPVMISQTLIHKWKVKKVRGSIVNISSLCAIRGCKSTTAYGSSKAAMEAFIRNIALEDSDFVIANTVRVAATGTKLMGKNTVSRLVEENIDKEEYDISRIPIKKNISKKDLATTISLLLFNQTSIIGQEINIDGGLSAKYPNYRRKEKN